MAAITAGEISFADIENDVKILFSNDILLLTLKACSLYVQHLGGGGGCFAPLCKIRSRHPIEVKLAGLIAYVMFYKIY